MNALDRELGERRRACERRARDEAWEGCSSEDDPAVFENCVLRCASAKCYADVYARDPLEEGEVDVERGRAFRACARDEFRKLRGHQTFES
jgi:hypothetical protein|tara:strand:- start:41 stop:313 length:273 start_codon:yes stop_codon:yes gene_type:complete